MSSRSEQNREAACFCTGMICCMLSGLFFILLGTYFIMKMDVLLIVFGAIYACIGVTMIVMGCGGIPIFIKDVKTNIEAIKNESEGDGI